MNKNIKEVIKIMTLLIILLSIVAIVLFIINKLQKNNSIMEFEETSKEITEQMPEKTLEEKEYKNYGIKMQTIEEQTTTAGEYQYATYFECTNKGQESFEQEVTVRFVDGSGYEITSTDLTICPLKANETTQFQIMSTTDLSQAADIIIEEYDGTLAQKKEIEE